MGINLTLAIDRYSNSGAMHCSQRTRLDWQDYDAFKRICGEAIPLTSGVHWYGDEGIEHRHTDQYGEPLTYMAAHTIARHLGDAKLSKWDAATLAYLQAIPPETRVVLWWC